mmetsp:Transcript_136700/g.437292  ORF Transcript_136700/g.437292 Transcript_136700/m.437292 type:complete len:220 (+) Transcript_136700:67-726(+)
MLNRTKHLHLSDPMILPMLQKLVSSAQRISRRNSANSMLPSAFSDNCTTVLSKFSRSWPSTFKPMLRRSRSTEARDKALTSSGFFLPPPSSWSALASVNLLRSYSYQLRKILWNSATSFALNLDLAAARVTLSKTCLASLRNKSLKTCTSIQKSTWLASTSEVPRSAATARASSNCRAMFCDSSSVRRGNPNSATSFATCRTRMRPVRRGSYLLNKLWI